jgi:diguanylate cyclase (GGDEF)-like protein/PAS domain S-box-containing protein
MRVVGSGRTRGAGARRAGAAVLVIVLAVLTGLGYVVVALSTSAVHEEARARVRTTAAVGATVIQREMVGMRTLVDSFARRTLLVRAVGQPAGKDRDAALKLQFQQLFNAHPGIAGVFLTETDGVLTHVRPITPEIVGRSFAHRDWYTGVRRTARPYVSEAYETAIGGKPLVVAVAAYVRAGAGADGVPLGIIAVVYRLDAIRSFTGEVAAAQGVQLTIIDQNGGVLIDRGSAVHNVTKTVSEPTERLLEERAEVDELGWMVRAQMPAVSALSPMGHLRRAVLSVIATVCLAIGLTAAYAAWELSRRRRAAAAVRAVEQRLRGLIDASNDAFVSVDAQGQVVEWNRAAEQLLGWTAAEAVGTDAAQLVIGPDLREAYLSDPGAAAGSGQRMEVTVLTRDGVQLAVEMSLWSTEGESGVFSAFLHDITDRQRHELDLLTSARTDPLTGAGNRLRLTEDLHTLSAGAVRHGRHVYLALVDVDSFKLYNDTYGHLAGDDVLRSVAIELRRVSRGGDSLYRYGGEEFVVVLADSLPGGAAGAAERLRIAVEDLMLPHVGSAFGVVTVSIGVAALAEPAGRTVDDALRAADLALYAAKGAGRNRVELHAADVVIAAATPDRRPSDA